MAFSTAPITSDADECHDPLNRAFVFRIELKLKAAENLLQQLEKFKASNPTSPEPQAP